MCHPLSQADEEQWYEQMRTRPIEEHPLSLEVRVQDGDQEKWKLIGDLGLMDFDWRNRSVEVGIFIGEKQLWNQGYGSEAMALMLRPVFKTLNINRVMLRVYETNQRAIRAYEKVGFVHEGRLRQAEHRNGEYIDVLFMSVLRNEWKETPE